MKGTILHNGNVLAEDGKIYTLPIRGTDKDGFPEVLLDVREIGGTGEVVRKSIQPFITMTVEFIPKGKGYNFKIIKT